MSACTSGDDNRREIQDLLEAYAALNDSDRDEEMVATMKLFHRIARRDGASVARQWMSRQVELIRREASK